MTDEEWALRIKLVCGDDDDGSPTGDWEGDHVRADEMLCELLTELGYEKTVAAWRKVNKWYA